MRFCDRVQGEYLIANIVIACCLAIYLKLSWAFSIRLRVTLYHKHLRVLRSPNSLSSLKTLLHIAVSTESLTFNMPFTFERRVSLHNALKKIQIRAQKYFWTKRVFLMESGDQCSSSTPTPQLTPQHHENAKHTHTINLFESKTQQVPPQ
jgi:hypothetical protein